MDADEISELAEALCASCAAIESKGFKVVPESHAHGFPSTCCPFGALISIQDWMPNYPGPDRIHSMFDGIDREEANDFMKGFDRGHATGEVTEMFRLGIRFREQALGEGFR